MVQLVKNLLAMWETWVGFLGWEDPLEEGMATHSSILAWEVPWCPWEPGSHVLHSEMKKLKKKIQLIFCIISL